MHNAQFTMHNIGSDRASCILHFASILHRALCIVHPALLLFTFVSRRISMVEKGVDIAPADGKLGILLVGLGAVSTTVVAGVEAIRRGLAQPVGSLTQMGTIRLGKQRENQSPKIK